MKRVALLPRSMRGFPFTRPTRPRSIEPLPDVDDLGINYDTDWARDPWAKVMRRVAIAGAMRPMIKAMADPEVLGLDRIEHLDGPAIFTANHHSHLDTMLLLSSIPDRLRRRTVVAAGADYFFDTRPKAATAALVMGAVPIERKKVSRRSSDELQRLLTEGWSLVIFPEGGRSPDGWGQDWKPGGAFLAVRTGLPVVPVHIEGTGRILPKGKSVPRRGTTIVTFGLPISPQPGEDARKLSARIEKAVTELADETTSDWWTARRRAAQGRTPQLTGPDGVEGWRRHWARTDRDRERTMKSERLWP